MTPSYRFDMAPSESGRLLKASLRTNSSVRSSFGLRSSFKKHSSQSSSLQSAVARRSDIDLDDNSSFISNRRKNIHFTSTSKQSDLHDIQSLRSDDDEEDEDDDYKDDQQVQARPPEDEKKAKKGEDITTSTLEEKKEKEQSREKNECGEIGDTVVDNFEEARVVSARTEAGSIVCLKHVCPTKREEGGRKYDGRGKDEEQENLFAMVKMLQAQVAKQEATINRLLHQSTNNKRDGRAEVQEQEPEEEEESNGDLQPIPLLRQSIPKAR